MRFLAVLIAVLALIAVDSASARTPRQMANARAAAMQTAFVGSVKLVGFFFTPNRPVTTPLMEWAKAATERARLERLRNQVGARQASIPVMSEDEAMFSRDRD